jgi:hypothetical protein
MVLYGQRVRHPGGASQVVFKRHPVLVVRVSGRCQPHGQLSSSSVRAVAEGLVPRAAAAAQGHSVANFVCVSIGAHDRKADANPQRSPYRFSRVINQANRRFVRGFDGMAGLAIQRRESSTGVVAGLVSTSLRASAWSLRSMRFHTWPWGSPEFRSPIGIGSHFRPGTQGFPTALIERNARHRRERWLGSGSIAGGL